MPNDDLKLSKKCFVKCGKGHRAYKVPGEKHTYYCSDCELQVTSDAKPYYVAQFEGKKKKGPKKKPGKKQKKVSEKLNRSYNKVAIEDVDFVLINTCETCFHKVVCFIVRDIPEDKISKSVCTLHCLPQAKKK